MAASPQYQAAAKAVEARNAAGFQQLAAKAGKSVEQVKAEVAAKAKALVNSQDVYVRVRDTTLPLILSSGRFKTTHETGTSEALPNAGLRKQVEAKGMGVSADEQDQTRPVSVYLGGKDFSTIGEEKGVGSYGSLVVKLKPQVRDRSTVTFGDSLQLLGNGNVVASPLNRISANTINPSEILHDPKTLESHSDYNRGHSMIEAQVHGGVSTHDIEEVGFPHAPDVATQKALQAHGIKWRVYGAKTHAATFSDDEPDEPELFTLEELNTFAAHKDGETWTTKGRSYKREGGKTVRIANPNASEKTAAAKSPAKAAPAAVSPPPPLPPPPPPPTKKEQQTAVKTEVEAAISDLKSANLPALASKIGTLTKVDIQALAKKANVWLPSSATKEKAAQKFISALKVRKDIAHIGESAPLVAGGKPSTHFDHIPNGTDFSLPKPSKAFTDANPYASAKALKDDYVVGRPNPDLPDEARPAVKDKTTAKFLNNYTWGYDGEMNAALRKTGASPPGPFGGEAGTEYAGTKKPDVDGPKMFAALQKTFAKTKPFGPPPVTVYRGLTSLPPEQIANMEAAAKKAMASGGLVTMPGFISTSTDKHGAFDGPVTFTIHAIQGIDTKPYSHFPTEDELLLNHNCQYRVKGVKRSLGSIHVELEQVSGGQKQKGEIALDGGKYSANFASAA